MAAGDHHTQTDVLGFANPLNYGITKIYALIDPRTNTCRYVGKTVNKLHQRLSCHCKNASKYHKSPAVNWIRSLRNHQLRPHIILLEECDDNWIEAEQFWIAYMRMIGARLTNLTPGGDGPAGYRHTDEAKQKIRASALGRKHSAKAIEKMRNKVFSAQHRERISKALKGIPRTEQQKIAIAKALTGRHPTEETRAKLRNRPCTAAKRRKLSEATKRYWDKRKGLI